MAAKRVMKPRKVAAPMEAAPPPKPKAIRRPRKTVTPPAPPPEPTMTPPDALN
jgi:hypothetical protein